MYIIINMDCVENMSCGLLAVICKLRAATKADLTESLILSLESETVLLHGLLPPFSLAIVTLL